MDDRQNKLQVIKDRQNKWMRERQAEMDRQRVMDEFQSSGRGPTPPQTANVAVRSSVLPPVTPPGPGPQTPSSAAPVAPRPEHGWAGLGARPEEVIDRLTERITDRLRSELKVELQRESETHAHQKARETAVMDNFLAHEMEAQNSCAICFEMMAPPEHAPVLLFPCGHTFGSRCINTHMETHHKNHCPLCRKKIESRALNFPLQQLIQQFMNRQQQVRSSSVHSSIADASSLRGEGTPRGGSGSKEGARVEGEPDTDYDRLRRQADTLMMRLRVLRNELGDTLDEERQTEEMLSTATVVEVHFRQEKAEVESRLAAVQAELALVDSQVQTQSAKVAEIARNRESICQRRNLLLATIRPLEEEIKKLGLLMDGVQGLY